MKGQISSEKGSLLPQFSCYALAKINPIFSDIQNRIFYFEVAALDMMYLQWSYMPPRSRINLLFVVSFIFLGDIGETKLIREATLKHHISGSLRGFPILRYGLELPWSQLNLGSRRPLMCTYARCSKR